MSDTDSYRREVEERRTKAIEDMAKSWNEPVVMSPVMPTPAAVVVEELDGDKLCAKLLVRCIKQIKDEDMKEDFKQHVNVIALQAFGGTWRSAQGASGEFSGWSNVSGQACVGQLSQQMPTSGNMGKMRMPMVSMHNMSQEEWDSQMGF